MRAIFVLAILAATLSACGGPSPAQPTYYGSGGYNPWLAQQQQQLMTAPPLYMPPAPAAPRPPVNCLYVAPLLTCQ